MYEIFSIISDEYGTRTVPTGYASFLESSAYDEMNVMQKTQPETTFYVEYVPSSDEWNAYWINDSN